MRNLSFVRLAFRVLGFVLLAAGWLPAASGFAHARNLPGAFSEQQWAASEHAAPAYAIHTRVHEVLPHQLRPFGSSSPPVKGSGTPGSIFGTLHSARYLVPASPWHVASAPEQVPHQERYGGEGVTLPRAPCPP